VFLPGTFANPIVVYWFVANHLDGVELAVDALFERTASAESSETWESTASIEAVSARNEPNSSNLEF